MTLPPSPSIPAALQLARFVARPVPFMENCRRRLGGTFTVRAPRLPDTVFISDPESIKKLFAADRVNSVASRRNLVLAPLLGDQSLLLIDGDQHLQRRRLMLPPFHGERMRAYEEVMVESTERELNGWPVGRPFTLHPAMQAITLDVIMRAVFGVSGDRREELRRCLLEILAATRSPLSIGLTLPGVRRLRRFRRIGRTIAEADRLLFEEITERRADPEIEQREDILSMLVAARDENGEGMSDVELRDQLMTLLLAGHETTATALAWTFDLLFGRPDAMTRLRDELDSGDEAYLGAVADEALRLRPVVPFVGRDLHQDMELAGYALPAGTTVLPAIYLAHTNPETFPDPYAFRPERFLEDGPETYSWIPFGGGTRRCLGAAFAQMEMKVVLRTILSLAELESAGEPQRMVRRNVTLSPADGTPAVLRRREAVAVA